MEKLLRLPAWAIFIYLLTSLLLVEINLTDDAFINSLVKVFGLLLFGLYPLSLGYILPDYLPKKISIGTTFFLVNWIVWIGVMIIMFILFGGMTVNLTGLYALPGFYLFFAVFHVFAFPIKVLKSIQTRQERSLSESMGKGLLLLFWPIGVWIIQPEIKRIFDTQVPTAELPA
ncbi:hypothetical protein J0A68_02725 [Algoriphagus sp. H41]|uniref:Uncharacterized protein n=1 Tax=Algoriphagus oliviformis TaxID=2811231 RepID=A0ABS3C124_9BACT|nr:hypothetical protein [Algoriphagus oliviformis]MBN7809851.1 hypothetical protein [Algoriphagus oliviformis]